MNLNLQQSTVKRWKSNKDQASIGTVNTKNNNNNTIFIVIEAKKQALHLSTLHSAGRSGA